MKIFKEIIAIISISFIGSVGFNAFSPHGIDILSNPWSKNAGVESIYQAENSNPLANKDPIQERREPQRQARIPGQSLPIKKTPLSL